MSGKPTSCIKALGKVKPFTPIIDIDYFILFNSFQNKFLYKTSWNGFTLYRSHWLSLKMPVSVYTSTLSIQTHSVTFFPLSLPVKYGFYPTPRTNDSFSMRRIQMSPKAITFSVFLNSWVYLYISIPLIY